MPQRSLATRSMKRFTRSPSTGLQVIAADLEMRADDCAVADREDLRDIVDVDAGVGEDRRVGHGVLRFPEVGDLHGLAGHRPGDEDDVGERGEDRALCPLRQRARPTGDANSALMLYITFMSARRVLARSCSAPAASGTHSPMSES